MSAQAMNTRDCSGTPGRSVHRPLTMYLISQM